MAKKDNSGKFWPYMILGFLAIGITLGYWTIKSAINMPVRESNAFMKKYQEADKGANEILEANTKFDAKYKLEITGLQDSSFKPKNLKRKSHKYFELQKNNKITIEVKSKDNSVVADAKIVLLLTRPQTSMDDKIYNNIKFKDGKYIVNNIKIEGFGRYILRLKISKDDAIKYKDIYCYRAKQE